MSASDEPRDDAREFNRLCEYLTNANIPILAAVLAEVARLEAKNPDQLPLYAAPFSLKSCITDAARAIRTAMRLKAGGTA